MGKEAEQSLDNHFSINKYCLFSQQQNNRDEQIMLLRQAIEKLNQNGSEQLNLWRQQQKQQEDQFKDHLQKSREFEQQLLRNMDQQQKELQKLVSSAIPKKELKPQSIFPNYQAQQQKQEQNQPPPSSSQQQLPSFSRQQICNSLSKVILVMQQNTPQINYLQSQWQSQLPQAPTIINQGFTSPTIHFRRNTTEDCRVNKLNQNFISVSPVRSLNYAPNQIKGNQILSQQGFPHQTLVNNQFVNQNSNSQHKQNSFILIQSIDRSNSPHVPSYFNQRRTSQDSVMNISVLNPLPLPVTAIKSNNVRNKINGKDLLSSQFNFQQGFPQEEKNVSSRMNQFLNPNNNSQFQQNHNTQIKKEDKINLVQSPSLDQRRKITQNNGMKLLPPASNLQPASIPNTIANQIKRIDQSFYLKEDFSQNLRNVTPIKNYFLIPNTNQQFSQLHETPNRIQAPQFVQSRIVPSTHIYNPFESRSRNDISKKYQQSQQRKVIEQTQLMQIKSSYSQQNFQNNSSK